MDVTAGALLITKEPTNSKIDRVYLATVSSFIQQLDAVNVSNSVTVLAMTCDLVPPALALRLVHHSCLMQVYAWPKGSDNAKTPFLTKSWVADGFGGRIIFSGAPTLPDQMPGGQKELRQQELDN